MFNSIENVDLHTINFLEIKDVVNLSHLNKYTNNLCHTYKPIEDDDIYRNIKLKHLNKNISVWKNIKFCLKIKSNQLKGGSLSYIDRMVIKYNLQKLNNYLRDN